MSGYRPNGSVRVSQSRYGRADYWLASWARTGEPAKHCSHDHRSHRTADACARQQCRRLNREESK